jgi:F-type H+-transporting ATPase subunit epsilon
MANNKLEVRVLTPAIQQGVSPYKYQGEADMVILRAETGDRGFLYGHEPCSLILDAGKMRIIGAAENEFALAVLYGTAQIEDNILTVITDTAEWPENIDGVRAQARHDELESQLEKAEHAELEDIKKEIRAMKVLIEVSKLPPAGIAHDK